MCVWCYHEEAQCHLETLEHIIGVCVPKMASIQAGTGVAALPQMPPGSDSHRAPPGWDGFDEQAKRDWVQWQKSVCQLLAKSPCFLLLRSGAVPSSIVLTPFWMGTQFRPLVCVLWENKRWRENFRGVGDVFPRKLPASVGPSAPAAQQVTAEQVATQQAAQRCSCATSCSANCSCTTSCSASCSCATSCSATCRHSACGSNSASCCPSPFGNSRLALHLLWHLQQLSLKLFQVR